MALFSHVGRNVMKARGHSSVARALASTLALGCVELFGCVDPAADPGLDDAGVGAAAGRVTIHTTTTNLPAVVASATLALSSMEAGSDREPVEFARVPLAAPIELAVDAQTLLRDAVPATYGSVRLLAIDSLTIRTAIGNTVVVDFVDAAPIELRCPGRGTYLAPAAQIDLTVTLDFSALQAELTNAGYYPPTLPLRKVTDQLQLASLFTTLAESLDVTCVP
jgi:hypothetical protein